jgi:hypothetical protein
MIVLLCALQANMITCLVFLLGCLWRLLDRLKMNMEIFKASTVKQARDICSGQLRWHLALILAFLG